MAVTDTKPFSGFEWMLSLRYLRSKHRDGFISIIAGFSFMGIVLGVVTMIVVMAVMNGFRKELMDKFLGINGHIIAYSSSDTTDFENARMRISNVEGIKSVVPFVEGAVLASTNMAATGAVVRGLMPDDVPRSMIDNIQLGSLERFKSKNGIMIGSILASRLGVLVGDQVTLLSPRGTATPFGVTPRILSYEVLATFRLGLSQYDASLILMPFSEARSFFDNKGNRTALEMEVEYPDEIDVYRERIKHVAGSEFYFVDWRESNQSLFAALEVERNVMFLILIQIILVATLNIVSGLIMLVKDKGVEIGLLRAMGATRGAVMRIFFITGASIGVMGTIVGLGIGLSICWNIDAIQGVISKWIGSDVFDFELYYLSNLPADIDTGETIMIVMLSLFLSFCATLYPAWRAAYLDPVEALRCE